MNFSILIPTRSRPNNVERVLNSILDTSGDIKNVEVLFYYDEDDEIFKNELKRIIDVFHDFNFSFFTEKPGIVKYNNWWDYLYKKSVGKYIMHGGDDLVFRTKNWDIILSSGIEEQITKNGDRILLAGTWDGAEDHKDGCLITHSILTKDMVENLGYFTTGYFSSNFNDTWFTEIAKKIDRLYYRGDILIDHLHPFYNKGLNDDVYKKQQESGHLGFKEWGQNYSKLEEDVKKLLNIINKKGD